MLPLSGQQFTFDNQACNSEPFRVVLPSLEGSAHENEISTKIWRSSLLMSAYILGLPVHISPPDEATCLSRSSFHPVGKNLVTGKDVLEVGCGRALPGLVAVLGGARRVAMCDCDHRCLAVLMECLKVQEAHACSEVGVYYQLWEEEQKLLEDLTEDGFSGSTRHWSNAYKGESQKLLDDDTFDVILCSDGLYFSPQVVPLVATLQRRLRKGGLGVLTIAARRAIGITADVSQALRGAGFSIYHDTETTHEDVFDWIGLQSRHVVGFDEATVHMSYTRNETGENTVLLIKWADQ